MEPLVVSWSQGGVILSVPATIAFLRTLITELISYYPKLKIFQHLTPPSFPAVSLNYLISVRSVSYGSTHLVVEHASVH